MRIIAGEHRGRRIEAPSENITRPTVDRVREAMFSSLESIRGSMCGACVLDAFAGSGAMAIEALSRGAGFACMLERNRAAFKVIGKNLRQLGIDGRKASLVLADAFTCAPVAPEGRRFDVVFLDPPYSYAPMDIVALMKRLALSGAVADDAIFLYEHDGDSTDAADEAYDASPHTLIKRRNYGRVVVDTLQ